MNWDNEKKPNIFDKNTKFLFTRNRMIVLVGSWFGIGFLLATVLFV